MAQLSFLPRGQIRYLSRRKACADLTSSFHADKFPSSSAFDAIDSVLSGSDSERKAAIKQANGVFAFTIKNKAGETESWHVDLKESGRVGKGLGKPT
ncbi:hypothetical protein E4U58_005209, partial [Claviceps cyperi]